MVVVDTDMGMGMGMGRSRGKGVGMGMGMGMDKMGEVGKTDTVGELVVGKAQVVHSNGRHKRSLKS